MNTLLVPLIPGLLLVVGTYLLHQRVVESQDAAIGMLCQSEANLVGREVEGRLILGEGAMRRLAAIRSGGDTSWREEAASLEQGELQFRAVFEADSALVPQTIVPAEARLLSTLDPRDDAIRSAALRVVTDTPRSEVVAVSTAPLTSGERQVLVCAPLGSTARGVAWLVGVVRLRDLLDLGFARTLRSGFSVGVSEGPNRVYGAGTSEGGPGSRFTRGATVARGPLLLQLQLWPAEDLARRLDSWGPNGLLVAGMLLAFFVSVSVYLWREERG